MILMFMNYAPVLNGMDEVPGRFTAILTEWGSSQFMYVGEAPKKKIS